MVSRFTIAAVAVTSLALSACGNSGLKGALGLDRSPPDEYQVVQHPPLVIPPDFNLRPPTPGAPRPQEGNTREEAKRLLTGTDEAEAGPVRTPGEAALLDKAGYDQSDPDIRRLINAESSYLAADDAAFVEDLMFWQTPDPAGSVIDPVAESARLQHNAEAGLPVTEGETPVIKRRVKAPLEGLNPF